MLTPGIQNNNVDVELRESSKSNFDKNSMSEHLNQHENSSYENDDIAGDVTVREYLRNNIEWHVHLIFLFCGGFHMQMDYQQLSVSSYLLLLWRSIMILFMILFVLNELQLLLWYDCSFRNGLLIYAMVFQFAMVIPVCINLSSRLNAKIMKHQKSTMKQSIHIFNQFLMFGVFVVLMYGVLLAFGGQYHFTALRLIVEAIGYGLGTLLATWSILFVIWDALVTQCELSELLESAENQTITADMYMKAYSSRYTDSESKSAAICSGVAFSAYFNLFIFIFYCLTTPQSESLILTAGFCFVFLSREASFLFFCFPYFVAVNTISNRLIDVLCESVWTHSNKVDNSTNMCLLVIRKPFKIVILGRIVTISEMRGQLFGLLFIVFTSIIRVVELQKYSSS